MNSSDYLHKEYPKTRSKKDFWGQIKRTVNGEPVSQDQIDMIVKTINTHLKFKDSDYLLDIACGNGALASYFFDHIAGYLGVDFSSYLIEIAKENFESKKSSFLVADALEFTQKYSDSKPFTKAIIYGSFSYFSEEYAKNLLKALHSNFKLINTIYLGNLPDREKAHLFYPNFSEVSEEILSDWKSAIGMWRTFPQISSLAIESGWKPSVYYMPSAFYSAHYRYDVLLQRLPNNS